MGNPQGFQRLTPLQIGLLTSGLLIFVLLLLADRTALEEQGGMTDAPAAGSTAADSAPRQAPAAPPGGMPSRQRVDPTETVDLALSPPLPDAAQQQAERLRAAIAEATNPGEKRTRREQLAQHLEQHGQPALAADALAPAADTSRAGSLAKRVAELYATACERIPAREAPKRFAVLNARSAAYYRAYVEQHPGDLQAKVQLALRLTNQTPPMKGVLMLRRLAEEHPGLYEAQLQLGRLSVRSNQWQKAEERFRNAITIRPKSAEAHFLLAQVLLNSPEGGRAKAQQHLRQAESLAEEASLRRAIGRLKARAFPED